MYTLTSTLHPSYDKSFKKKCSPVFYEASGAAAYVIAMDGIAVITDRDNPVTALTTKQLADIYTGQARPDNTACTPAEEPVNSAVTVTPGFASR